MNGPEQASNPLTKAYAGLVSKCPNDAGFGSIERFLRIDPQSMYISLRWNNFFMLPSSPPLVGFELPFRFPAPELGRQGAGSGASGRSDCSIATRPTSPINRVNIEYLVSLRALGLQNPLTNIELQDL